MTSVGTFLEEMCGTKHEESHLPVHQEEPLTSPRINELLVNQAPVEVVVEEIHMVKEAEEFPPLELKALPKHLEYAFLDDNAKMPVIISSALDSSQKDRLLAVLRKHKQVIAWRISDIKESTLLTALTRFLWRRTISQWSNISAA
jgi:hypothetical protein